MNKKNLINFFLIFVIFITLSFVFWKEYFDFHKKQREINKNISQTIKKSENFKLNQVKDIKNTEVFYTPYPKLIEKIVEKINSAEKRVYLETYIFTEKRIKKALKNAKNRNLDVKVLLEKNPYMVANINNRFFNELKKSGVDIAWSNTKNFKLNHSKFFIIDDEAIISTWNITYSTFKFNRDFFVFLKDKEIIKSLEEIFLADFKWIKTWFYDESLVVSPYYSRKKIEKLLNSAEKEIKIYMQYLKDEKINNLILDLQKKWIDIKIIVNKNNLEDEEIVYLKEKWIQIKALEKQKMHSKVIIVDKKYIFIWSENFSSYSLDKNREIWIILKEESLIKKVLEIFETDFKLAIN